MAVLVGGSRRPDTLHPTRSCAHRKLNGLRKQPGELVPRNWPSQGSSEDSGEAWA